MNMRLMKSSFGHAFMVMGGRGAALYPRDESMRYKGDPMGERLTSAEMAQKVKLEKCFGRRSQPGPKGRMPIKGPMQRLALMMALMVLGMPPVYSCHVPTGCGMLLGVDTSEPRICPPIGSETRIGVPALKTEMDEKQWVRLPAIRCMAMQSSDAENQVREVQATLWSATNGVLGSSRERQAESGGDKVPREDEPD